jgi:hypothetical protein
MRYAILVGLALGAAQPAAWSEPRAGKVVRIERGGRGRTISPRFCIEMHGSGDAATGMCFGPEPRASSVIEVLDDTRIYGVVRVAEVERAMPNCDGFWQIKGSVIAGELASGTAARAVGIIDGGLERRRAHRIPEDRVRSPNGNSDEHVGLAIDRDGTGTNLLVATQYTCDSQGQPSALGTAQCVDNSAGSTSSRLTRVQQTIGCNF